ncbi:MAG: hypothetical protein NT031_08630, partial [Planctomycetota bacterium]|nr:hypothetical protein [Planctomycetota bacterium]
METGASASHSSPRMEDLEPRQLLAAGGPTAYAQYLLELINRARANPADEAALYSINLNEGLVAGTISTAAKGPLAFNQTLLDAAVDHQTWMFQTELFQHTGMNGTTALQRITAAGYVPTASGENIGVYEPGSGMPDMISDTARLHQGLFVDTTDIGRNDRLRLMDSSFREIGIGVLGGPITGGSAIAATEDLARAAGNPFLTGVVYDNRLALMDDFYTPGEGLADVTVTAVKHGGGIFSTTTWASGGYSLALAAGTYDVTFSGGELGGAFAFPNVVVAASNVKQDFVADNPPPTADLTVALTNAPAVIYARPSAAFSLQTILRNIGNARADGPFDVAIYRSNDATVTAADTQIDTYALASLNAHATSTTTRALTAPAAPGTYYLAVVADDTNVVNESSEINNWSSVVTLVVGEPDLQVDLGSFTLPAMLVPGDKINVPLVITNAGAIPAVGTITNEVYASVGLTQNPGDQLLASVNRAISLAPGATLTLPVSIPVTDALPLATWHILAAVDTTNAVVESDETNNIDATAGTFDQVWRFGTFAARRGVKLVVHDAGGTLVTFTPSGPGWGSVALVAGGFNVTMTDSTSATGLKVTTAGPATSLNDHTNGGVVTNPATQAALSLGALTNSVIDAGDEPIRSFKALQWLDGGGPADTLDAPAIGSISVTGQKANPAKGLLFLPGDFEPALTTPGAVGASTIAGTLRNTWAALRVASLKAAALDTVTLTGDTAGTNVTISTNGPRTTLNSFPAQGLMGSLNAKAHLVGT